MLLTQEEVIKRLCKMCSKVRTTMSKKKSVASDCFCGQSVPDPLGFQFDSKVSKFVEDAVAAQMRLDKIAERYYK